MKKTNFILFFLLVTGLLFSLDIEFVTSTISYNDYSGNPSKVIMYFNLVAESEDDIGEFLFIQNTSEYDLGNNISKVEKKLNYKIRYEEGMYKTYFTFTLTKLFRPYQFVISDISNPNVGWQINMRSSQDVDISKIEIELDEEIIFMRELKSFGG